jgi:tetratricopeptide (TPR) repeat protein
MKLITLGIIGCLSLVTLSSQGAPPDKAAWAAYENGNYSESYRLFFQLFREQPQDERIAFGLGLAALKTGKLSHAKFAFERVLASSPDNQRARLELGRTLAAMGLYELAQEEFQKVLQCNPPEQVRTNVEKFLGQIKRSARPWTAEAQLSLGAFYDDNINIGPSESLIDTGVGRLQVDPHSLPETAVGLSAGLNAASTYDIGMREDWFLTAGLNTVQTWLPDNPEYELRYLRTQAGIRH